jgi:hypothetical protein
MRRLHLRVLYTINSSSYILARSPTPVLVTPVNPSATQPESYGSVSFKTCLEAICRSSPELVPTGPRDFSVYVLDPLESNAAPAPIDITNSAGSSIAQTRGVAVGMGSMSLGLSTEEQEPVTVVGTLSKTGAGQDALEVIIALREVNAAYTLHPTALLTITKDCPAKYFQLSERHPKGMPFTTPILRS